MSMMIPELTDNIIDHLHDNRPALCSCSLVCRSWLPSSRFHLFSTVVLCFIDINTGLPMICSQSSTIAPYVRHLELEDGWNGWRRWLNDALPKLPNFGALKSLALGHIDWAQLTREPRRRDRLIGLSRCLNHLALEYVKFETMDQVLDLFYVAPSLEKVSLASVQCENENVSHTRSKTISLKEITFAGGSLARPLIDWLCLQPMPSVHTLNLAFVRMNQVPSISRYLKILGPKLEHLGLECSGECQDALCKAIDLSHNTSLCTISIDGIVLYDNYSNSPGARIQGWVIDILSQITSRYISMVTLIVLTKTPQEIYSLDLPALSLAFTGVSSVLSERNARLRFHVLGEVNRSIGIRWP
ncbi:hypothetical protein BD410DRAFT_792104 [Rickenella mellea]|uniref:F-box domain-containing protein n=1 Tax=Rickenella mellea TaxID=50990 RepID=A0A4Y7PVR5_9AGAM|nr:hypothetical protein BD410DRAFT_792104 [Rickenella mellea]